MRHHYGHPARALAITLVLFTGCEVPIDWEIDSDHEHGIDIVRGLSAKKQSLAISGPWAIPADVMAVGDTQAVTFDNAPPYNGGANCASGPTPGALTLRDYLITQFPQIDQIGVYNCRVIAGTNSMSLHGVGRALDIMISTEGGDADNGAGDPIGNWLIEHAELLGIQTVIWDSVIWRVSNSPRAHSYTGTNPHIDHLHVEINIEASVQELPWYGAPAPPEDCDPLVAGVQILEEDDPCFQLFGPSTYWRHVSGAGRSGELYWTNAFESTVASNWARWSLPVPNAGPYSLEVYIDEEYGLHSAVPYTIDTGVSTLLVHLDQSAAPGWRSLGLVQLANNGTAAVVVGDNSPVEVGESRSIAVDALRITPVPAEQGCTPLPPEGGTLEETHPCLTLYGPMTGWRSEPLAGSGGGLLWTHGFHGTEPINWAKWDVPVSMAGNYEVEVFLPSGWANFPTTHYEVTSETETAELLIDGSLQSGWVSLGVYPLSAGEAVEVRVFDHHTGDVSSARRIVVDAIRARRLGSADGVPDSAESDSTDVDERPHDTAMRPGRLPRPDNTTDTVLDAEDPGTGSPDETWSELPSCGSTQRGTLSPWLGVLLLLLGWNRRGARRVS